MEATSAAPNTLNLWRPKDFIFFVLVIPQDDKWSAKKPEWTEAAVRASGPIIHRRVQYKDHKCETILQPKAPSLLSEPLSGGKLDRVDCHLLLVRSVQSSQSSKLRSSKGFEKTFCFCLLASFIEILFSFSRRTLCRPAESKYEQRVGCLWLYCAWLATPVQQYRWAEGWYQSSGGHLI